MGQINGDGDSGPKSKFREEVDEFSMGSLKWKAAANIRGEIFCSAVEVRDGTQEGVWTTGKLLGVSKAAVIKTMGVDEAHGQYACLRMRRRHLPTHRYHGLRYRKSDACGSARMLNKL